MQIGRATAGLSFLVGLISLATPLFAASILTGDLPRRADPGFRIVADEGALLVADVDPESAAARSGLAADDRIVAIDGVTPSDLLDARESTRRWIGGREVVVRLADKGDVRFTPAVRPLEAIEGVETVYGVVDMDDGSRLRTLVSRPEGSTGKLPAIFFTQWVSCGSIEHNPGSTSRDILATLARDSGFLLIRVERASDGDSVGPSCHELDYDTELSHYRQALLQLVQHPDVDPDRVVIYGSSLGSTTAVLLAHQALQEGIGVAGLVVQGGGAVTYLERMIGFDRFYLERRSEIDPRSIHDEMVSRIRFHTEYLGAGRSPDDVARDSPEMAAVRADVRGMRNGLHYGRPYAWHQQAARHNFLGAWADVDAPVLVVFNEYDQFETRHGHRLITDVVNRLRPGTATFVELPGVGHSNALYPSEVDAYAGREGEPVPQLISSRILGWLRSEIG